VIPRRENGPENHPLARQIALATVPLDELVEHIFATGTDAPRVEPTMDHRFDGLSARQILIDTEFLSDFFVLYLFHKIEILFL
jgi:hypothetical protein